MEKDTIENFPDIEVVICSKMAAEEKHKLNFMFRDNVEKAGSKLKYFKYEDSNKSI